MITGKSLMFLEQMLKSSGPSGFEFEAAAVYRDYVSQFADKVHTDVTGNTIGVLNEKADFKVMLAGHYDEIGFQVVHISDEGLLYFRNVGGIDKLTVPGTEVNILTEKGAIHGVIGKKPIHLTEGKDRDQAIELKNLWIDIGAENKKEAERIIRIGDPVAVKTNYARLGKNRIMSKGVDDKIGAFIVAETLRELSARKISVSVYGVGTVQEEIGLRGARTSAFGIAPDVGFVVDMGFATDTPDIEKKTLGTAILGKGPILHRSADNNPAICKILRETARKNNIKYQESAWFTASGGTDTAQIQMDRCGVATSLIGIPARYMHTPVEMCDIRDVEAAIRLLTETIATLKPGQTFTPGIDG